MDYILSEPSPKSILVVDDEAQIRRALGRTLRRQGFAVREAQDGVEALENLAAEGAPSVVVLDLLMPRMDGRQFLSRVRQTHPELPVLVCTASEAKDLEGLPFVQVLEKPWTVSGFLEKLDGLLD
ncbi:MAG: response regulator [Myxococcota bacterium]|nr:response regulator [Myxococcota bacterium]